MPRKNKTASARGTRLQSIVSGTTYGTSPSGVTIDGTNGIQLTGTGVALGNVFATYTDTDAYIFERGVADSANNGLLQQGVTATLAVTLSAIGTCYGVFTGIQLISTGSSVAGSSVSRVITSFSGSGVTFTCWGEQTATAACNNGTSIQYLAFGTA